MSRIAYFFILFLVPVNGHCQPLITLSETDNARYEWLYVSYGHWYSNNDTVYGSNAAYWTYLIDGRRTEGRQGKTYQKMFCMPLQVPTAARSASQTQSKQRDYTIGVRRDGGRVYVNREEYLGYLNGRGCLPDFSYSFGTEDYIPYPATEDGELVLYDYNMEKGDTYLHVEGHEDVSVVAKETIELGDGQPRRRLELSNGLVLIEGVGCINSNGMLIDYLNPQEPLQPRYTYLHGLYNVDGGQTVYNGPDGEIIDQDIADIRATQQSAANQNSSFDLQGRRLGAKPRRGIYIENGRKQVVK